MFIRRLANLPTGDWRRPFEELDRMRHQLDRLFEDPALRIFGQPSAKVFPLINLTEDKEHYYVRAELPGIRPEELEMSVTGDALTIAGERKIPAENKDAKYHRREREAGKFSRIISLPSQVDAAKVEARCVDGLLTVTLPKPETAKPKQISVKTP
jgi:HSP20 family protein